MILFLNYIPTLLTLAALGVGWWAIHNRKWKVLYSLPIIFGLLIWLFLVLSNSGYISRGTVERMPVVENEESTLEMQDRLRKPERNTEESDERLKELSDWRKHKKEREEQQ